MGIRLNSDEIDAIWTEEGWACAEHIDEEVIAQAQLKRAQEWLGSPCSPDAHETGIYPRKINCPICLETFLEAAE